MKKDACPRGDLLCDLLFPHDQVAVPRGSKTIAARALPEAKADVYVCPTLCELT